MFACFLSTPSYLLLAVMYLGGFSIVGTLAQFSFLSGAICYSFLFAWAGSTGGACLFPSIYFGWCEKDAEERRSVVLRFDFILSLALLKSLASQEVLHKYLLNKWLRGIGGREKAQMWRADWWKSEKCGQKILLFSLLLFRQVNVRLLWKL